MQASADGHIWWLPLVIRSLTPRFSPALGVESSRYIVWFNIAMQHSELFHALIALSQVYYNIDVKGFGSTHWTALYHRGEALKQLRYKVESGRSADDDAAILTALWLMDVEVSAAKPEPLLCSCIRKLIPLTGFAWRPPSIFDAQTSEGENGGDSRRNQSTGSQSSG